MLLGERSEITFYYGTMNSGKSTAALQMNYNLKQAGFKPLLCKSVFDNRHSDTKVVSRIGIEHDCHIIGINDNDLGKWFMDIDSHFLYTHLIIDEVQFLNHYQVTSLLELAEDQELEILCYGLRTSWKGQLFAASKILFAFADNLIELPYTYKDGMKAVAHIKMNRDGDCFDKEYNEIEVGDTDKYESVSRREYIKRYNNSKQQRK